MLNTRAAWVSDEGVDAETVARISYLLYPRLQELGVRDSAAPSGLAIEAANIFQTLHFSYDHIYWDDRDFPEMVAAFAYDLARELQNEPDWINTKYATGGEGLDDFLRRRRFDTPQVRQR